MNRIDLNGRVAVVTGGASGIGTAIAMRYAASGARVFIWDMDGNAATRVAAMLPAVSGGAHAGLAVDVTNEQAVDAVCARTVAEAGQLDVMCCSAGIAGPNITLEQYPTAEWMKVFATNVHGVFFCNRVAVREMGRHNYGRIVNIASIAGKDGNPNASAYSASKAAVIAMTKSLGKETATTGIRVNCVTPAAVRTAIFEQLTQQHIDYMLSKIPMGRFGEVDEIASMIAWMSSEECSFTTGSVFDLSGGRAVY